MKAERALMLSVLFLLVLAASGSPASASAAGPAQDPDDFLERLRSIDRGDTAALLELAAWCLENKMDKERRQVLEMILMTDPDNEQANLGLGRVRYEGRWMTPEKRRELLASKRAERMRAMGLVQYRGAWVTPGEKEMLEKGFVRHEGKWMTPEEAKAAEGYVQDEGKWVKKDDLPLIREMRDFAQASGVVTAFHSSGHFGVFSEFGDGFNRKLASQLEAGYAWFEENFGSARGPALFGGRKPLVVAFNERKAFDAYITFFSGFQENMTDGWTRHAREVLGFAWWDPTCYSAAYKGPRLEEEVMGQILHQMGHVLVNRKGYNFHYLPPWFDEGFASLFEFQASRQNWAFCIQGRNLISSVNDDELFSGNGWRGLLGQLVSRGIDPDFTALMIKEMDLMDQDDVAKAMGLTLFLAQGDGGRAGAFLDIIQRRIPRDAGITWDDAGVVQVQLDALEHILSAGPEEADLAFRTWWKAAAAKPGEEPGGPRDE